MNYFSMSREQLQKEYEKQKSAFEAFRQKGLSLDMSRGKPGADQLGITEQFFAATDGISPGGVDCRNYGCPDGLPEVKALFAPMMQMPAENIVIGGSSSLNMMYDKISSAMTHGINGGTPWAAQGGVRFLCPVPGYDRHFTICEYFGIEMLPVPMTENGPDMDVVERLVSTDEKVKGIWCVPKYSNPQGITCSDETVRRFAALKPAAKDFRIFWDNAYCVHDLNDHPDQLLSLYDECVKNGSENMVYVFASTSKISFPGAGVAAMGTSTENLAWDKKRLFVQTVCANKMNMLFHLNYFKSFEGILAQMKIQAEKLSPKFDLVCNRLQAEFGENPLLRWHRPNGGYFVSVDAPSGCAKRVVSLCAEGGVKLTGAGATWPYQHDPQDSNIRLAPTFPSLPELENAMELFCLCVKLASMEKLLEQK